MGQEIFYCGTCKTLLKTPDLEKGDAVRIDDVVYCRACAPAQAPSTPRRISDGRRARSWFYPAVNLNGPALLIDGQSWEGKDAPHVSRSGDAFDRQDIPLRPPVDGPKAQMIRSSVWKREGLTLTIVGVPRDGIWFTSIPGKTRTARLSTSFSTAAS